MLFSILISALSVQSAQAVPFTSVSECVVGREVQARPFGARYGPVHPGVIAATRSDPGNTLCLVRFIDRVDGNGWTHFSLIATRSASVQAAVDTRTAADAAAVSQPAHIQEARRQFLAAPSSARCRMAHLGIAAGPDLAREVLGQCRYNKDDWDRAQTLNPTWNINTVRAEGLRLQAADDHARAVWAEVAEKRRAEDRAEQVAADSRAAGNGSGATNRFTGATVNVGTVSDNARASTPATVSERTIREGMARDACHANVRNC